VDQEFVMAQTPTVTPPPTTDFAERPRPKSGSAWSGWIIFAGVMLGLVGSFQLIEGFVALFEDSFFLVARHGLVVHMSYTAWGWVHLAIGAANIFAGFGLFAGRTAARIWAILVASISAIANLGFTSAYPTWTVVIITLDVIVIYALCVHWDEVERI
jgi:hypothetical protein